MILMFGRSKVAAHDGLEQQVNASFTTDMAVSLALFSTTVVKYKVGDLRIRGSKVSASVECADERKVSVDTAGFIAKSLRDCLGDHYRITISVHEKLGTVPLWVFIFGFPMFAQTTLSEHHTFNKVRDFHSWLNSRNPHETTIDSWRVTLTRR